MASRFLRFPALEIRQGSNRVLYSFAADGKDVYSFATVSRIRRVNEGEVCGYQRPEVLSHIAEIRKYLECSDPMIPNAIVIAFDERVCFEAADDSAVTGFSRPGVLVVPVDEGTADHEKPGLDRRWPTADGRYSRGIYSLFSDLHHSFHRQRRDGAEGAVHSRQFYKASSQGTDL